MIYLPPVNRADPISDLHPRVGDGPFAGLVAAFYAGVRTDDLLGPMYPPDDWANAETRLRGFLIQRCGGPDGYSRARGHPRLRMRHAPFPIDAAARDRWLTLMDAALDASAFAEPDRALLRGFFAMVADHLVNRG